MASVYAIDKDSSEAAALKADVCQKVLEFIPEDPESADTLALYVVVLLSKGRGRDEIKEELISLLDGQPEAGKLHEW
jgi:hypothetical protein